MDTSLSKLWEAVKKGNVGRAAISGVSKSQIWLSGWITATAHHTCISENLLISNSSIPWCVQYLLFKFHPENHFLDPNFLSNVFASCWFYSLTSLAHKTWFALSVSRVNIFSQLVFCLSSTLNQQCWNQSNYFPSLILNLDLQALVEKIPKSLILVSEVLCFWLHLANPPWFLETLLYVPE